jgi:hypothetical protein
MADKRDFRDGVCRHGLELVAEALPAWHGLIADLQMGSVEDALKGFQGDGIEVLERTGGMYLGARALCSR